MKMNPWIWAPIAVLTLLLLYRRKIAEEWHACQARPKEWLYEKWKNWGEPFLVAAVLAFAIRTFLLGPYKIPTGSMIPTFLVGDRIFVDKITYHFRPPKRGEIVVFKYPVEPKKEKKKKKNRKMKKEGKDDAKSEKERGSESCGLMT